MASSKVPMILSVALDHAGYDGIRFKRARCRPDCGPIVQKAELLFRRKVIGEGKVQKRILGDLSTIKLSGLMLLLKFNAL